MPLIFAKLIAKILQMMPEPLLTIDQLKLLKYDNVTSGKYKTNFDLNIDSKKFQNEIDNYSFNWSSGGQFSKKKLKKINAYKFYLFSYIFNFNIRSCDCS